MKTQCRRVRFWGLAREFLGRTYSYVFLRIPTYSYVFLRIPAYSCVFVRIRAYSYVFVRIRAYSRVFVRIRTYSRFLRFFLPGTYARNVFDPCRVSFLGLARECLGGQATQKVCARTPRRVENSFTQTTNPPSWWQTWGSKTLRA